MLQPNLLRSHEIIEEKWNDLLSNSEQRSIYFELWFLRIIHPKLEVLIISEKDAYIAALLLNFDQKYGLEYSLNSKLAQFQGVIFRNSSKKFKRSFHFDKVVLQTLIKNIPNRYKLLKHNLHPSVDYLLPFQWSGFQLEPKHTYWVHLKKDFRKNFSNSVLSDLRKAQKTGLKCVISKNLEFLKDGLLKKTLFSKQELKRLDYLWERLQINKRGILVNVENQHGEIECSSLFLKDFDRIIYYLCVSSKKNNGANSLAIEFMMNQALENNLRYFDFEGSMIESIEHYFRGFGPIKKIYFNISLNKLSYFENFLYSFKKLSYKAISSSAAIR
ncbi:MAG: hypothetical protein MRY83_21865 [Flavobacteriales bacterium]|nr:hypothetical protein [Flavobacteriales bacterium]